MAVTLERGISHGISHEHEPRPERELLIVGHTYQPPREILKPTTGERIGMVPEVNERIYQECYKPIFVDSEKLPEAVFSFYPTLREWIKTNHTTEFQEIRRKVKTLEDKEYKILGDPYVHAILPLLSRADQDTLVNIGKEAFYEDLGFYPKGLWLPESAVSSETLDVLKENEYEFVVLRDSQLESRQNNPMTVSTKHGDMVVFHFESGLSGSVSYEDRRTINGDEFLENIKWFGKTVSIGTDTERYGHHEPKGKDKFLLYVANTDTLRRHGFETFNIKDKLETSTSEETKVKEGSSWSCEHNMGRWTGDNNCECTDTGHPPSNERLNEKRWLSVTLGGYGIKLNQMLDQQNPKWRQEFIPFFLSVRRAMFDGNYALSGNEDPLMLAKVCQLIGMTSCGWFFSDDNRIETRLNHAMNSEIPKLIEMSRVDFAKAA